MSNRLRILACALMSCVLSGGLTSAPAQQKTFHKWSEKALVQDAWRRIQGMLGKGKEQLAVEYRLDENGVLCSVATKVYFSEYRKQPRYEQEILQDGVAASVIKVHYHPCKSDKLSIRKGSTNAFGGVPVVRVISSARLQA